MKQFLHISDFHFTSNAEQENQILVQLGEFLKTKIKLPINYIIHTGDFIDSNEIAMDCGKEIIEQYKECFPNEYRYNRDNFGEYIQNAEQQKSGIIKDYNEKLLQKSNNRFNEAANYFLRFITQLGVDISNVVICCGNHDKTRLVFSLRNDSVCENNQYQEMSDDKECFECFDNFCLNIGVKCDHKARLLPKADVDFLILNSQWKMPEQKDKTNSKACTNCSEVGKILETIKENDKPVIAVRHKPQKDMCENYLYQYPDSENRKPSISDKVMEKVHALCCGDKHTAAVEKSNDIDVFLSGAPLAAEHITYNLISYDESAKKFIDKFLVWNNRNWRLIPSQTMIKKVYNLSKTHIIDYCFRILQENEKVHREDNVNDALDLLSKFKENGRSKWASDLFKSVCKYREKGNNGVEWDKKCIFDSILTNIKDSMINNPINIKGDPNSGKSTFMGIQYLYILESFRNGDLQYIPAYFNLDKVASDDTNLVSSIYEKFRNFQKEYLDLSERSSMPIIYIIDGLDQQNCRGGNKTIEELIYGNLTQQNQNKYILIINKSDFPKLSKSFEKEKDDSDLVYFNPVDIISVGNKSNRFEDFICSYLRLFNESRATKEQIIAAIKDYQRINIDMGFMNVNLETIVKNIKTKKMGDEVLKEYKSVLAKRCKDKLQTNIHNKEILKATYLLSFEGRSFNAIKERFSQLQGEENNEEKEFDYNIFLIIKKNKDIREYLIACYYVHELKEYANQLIKPTKDIPKESILNKFISRNISLLVRYIFTDDAEVMNTCEALFSSSNPKIHSMALYLIGNLKVDEIKRQEIITDYSENHKDKFNINSNDDSRNVFFKKAVKRSLKIANIVCVETKDKKAKKELLRELIHNADFRIHNRIYQLLYYGDLSANNENNCRTLDPNNDKVHKEFDFHHCLHYLVSKLSRHDNSYKLMELDLFTLCDIVHSRLQCAKVKEQEKEYYTYFYYDGYKNGPVEVLQIMIDLLDKYFNLKSERDISDEYSRINVYFSMMRTSFKACKNILSTKKNERIERIKDKLWFQTHYIDEFIKLIHLGRMNRIAWELSDDQAINDEIRKQYLEREPKETIGEHIYESAVIAWLYLPKVLNKDDINSELDDEQYNRDKETYNKESVITYIFTQEFGKIRIGEYPEDIEKHGTFKSEEYNQLLFILMLGAIDTFGDMTTQYEIVHDKIRGNHTRNINRVLAEDILIIQQLYKFKILQHDEKINFSLNREKQFEAKFSKLQTNLGKKIYEQLSIGIQIFLRMQDDEKNKTRGKV